MLRNITLLLAVAAMIAATSITSDARVRDRVLVKDDRGEAFEEFERLLPMATASDNEDNVKEVKEVLTKGKSPWLTLAAIEAVRQAELDKRGSGQVFFGDVLSLMGQDFDKLHKEELVPLNVIACLGVLANGDEEKTLKVVRSFIAWQRWSENGVVRLRHMVERVLMDLCEEDCAFNADTLTFWEWWVRQKENKQDPKEGDKPPEKKSKTAPIIFKEPMVGTHVVFVIDVSDSMKWPIKEQDLPKIKKSASHLNWDEMPDPPSPMDLAKAELRHSIDKLRPDKDEKGKAKKGSKGSKNDEEMRQFAIVTYSTEIEMFTEGWIEATDKACDNWMDSVDELETEHMTNIHGALIEAFSLNDGKRPSIENIPVDKECVLTGAHTIVFLTDGYPTWSMDSTEQTGTDEWGRANQIGNGEYVKRDKLIELERIFNRFRKVVINTVGIGIHDKELMKAFAKNTGGGYTDWYCGVDYGQGSK